ncbi:MAG: hypothetical protein C0421_07975 [Hyphomonas sp.]|uniref:hypothetical protein n=1 Tax=Hyphomonas sp. TaxID=87 RepID=UPI0025C2C6A2|nr:hypothetical protein [Hyphomonas sp.]MBA4338766.1 hypothetical protein [Hyphomonas sp.]
METSRILSTLIAHPDISVTELAKLCGANRHTVQTVLQRHQRALISKPCTPAGKKGRPQALYRVAKDWIPVLRARWEDGPAVEVRSPLEEALRFLEAASLAAIDPAEDEETRRRMKSLAELRLKSAFRLAQSGDARPESLERIERARRRLGPDSEEHTGISPLGHWWGLWTKRLADLGVRYKLEAEGSDLEIEKHGLAVVIDLIPENSDPVETAILQVLRGAGKPYLCARVGTMTKERQAAFAKDFKILALDPIARHADLYVTVDSSNIETKRAWNRIDKLAHVDHAKDAMKVADEALIATVRSAPNDPLVYQRLACFYNDFVASVQSAEAEADGSLWRVLGTPMVLDQERNAAFQHTVEERDWDYFGRAAEAQADLKLMVFSRPQFRLAGRAGD